MLDVLDKRCSHQKSFVLDCENFEVYHQTFILTQHIIEENLWDFVHYYQLHKQHPCIAINHSISSNLQEMMILGEPIKDNPF